MKILVKKLLFSALATAGTVLRTGGVSVICYHSIDDEDSLISTPTKMFRTQMEYLRDNDVNVISLKKLLESLASPEPLPKKTVVLTFDDGFEGVYDNAYPILRELGYPATLFVVTDSVGKTMSWERVKGICAYNLCSWEKLKELDEGGIDIQSHTRTHAFLTELDDDALASEVGGSKAAIEENLHKKVEYLSYPYGDYNDRVMAELKKQGIKGAVTGTFGKARKDESPLAVRRVGTEIVSGKDIEMLMNFFKACVSGTATLYVGVRNVMPILVKRHKRSQYTSA